MDDDYVFIKQLVSADQTEYDDLLEEKSADESHEKFKSLIIHFFLSS